MLSHSLNSFLYIREPVCFVWFIVSSHPWPAYSGGVRECFWSLKKGEKAGGYGWMRSWDAPSSLLVKNCCFADEYGDVEESAKGCQGNQVSLCRSLEDIGLKLLISGAQDLIPQRKCYSLGIFVVQSLSHVWLFAAPWTAACQPSLSFTISGGGSNSCPLNRWCHPTISSSLTTYFSCPQSFPGEEKTFRVFSNESALHIKWPKY